MRSGLSTALKAALVAQANTDLTWLVEILDSTPIYRTTRNVSLVFDGKTYLPDSMAIGPINASLEPESPRLDFRIQNVENPVDGLPYHWGAILGARTLNAVTVNFRLVKISLLPSTDAELRLIGWKVSGPAIEGTDALFPLGPPHDILHLEGPSPSIAGGRCRFEVGDENCKSTLVGTVAHCENRVEGCGRHHSLSALRYSQLPYSDQALRRRRP